MWHRWSDDTLQSFRESSKMKMRIELTEIDEKLLNNVGIVIRVWRSFFLFSNEKYSRIDKICWFCKLFLKNQRAFLCNLEIFKLKEMYSSTQPPPPLRFPSVAIFSYLLSPLPSPSKMTLFVAYHWGTPIRVKFLPLSTNIRDHG